MSRKEKIIKIILIALIAVLAVTLETIWTLNIENLGLYRALIKAAIGLSSIGISLFSLIRLKNLYAIILTIILSLFTIADVSINFSFATGGGIFALGHLILLVYFLRRNKLKVRNFIVTGITYAVFLVIILVLNRSNIYLMIALMVYALLISFLLSSTLNENPWIRIGVLVFVISDALLMINIGINSNLILGHFARGVYYLSVVLLSITHKEEKNFVAKKKETISE